jgi:hypothetical protein
MRINNAAVFHSRCCAVRWRCWRHPSPVAPARSAISRVRQFLLLLVDNLVECIDGIFLMRQFQLDVDQTFFVDHGVFSL